MASMRPSETEEGQRWLSNFLSDDISTAMMLLDSLHFVPEDVFRASLIDLLNNLVLDELTTEPIVLYPVRPPQAAASYVEPAPDRPWSAEDGSEHIVANMLTEIVRACGTTRHVSASVPLDKLRSSKVRTVVLVDDYIGSGTTAAAFLDRWWANPTIKSWRSFGLIKFILVAYACSSAAHKMLLKHRILDDLRWVEFGVDFNSAHWDAEERNRIRSLCINYAHNHSMALGYRRSEGLLVMSHTVPNNLPQIFRHGAGPNQPWVSFFAPGPRRISPALQLRLGDYRPEADFQRLASRLRQPRLAEGYIAEETQGARPLLLLLAALTRSPRSDNRLTQELGLTIFELRNLLLAAQTLELIDKGRHLTDQGRAVLHHAGRRQRAVKIRLQGSEDPYYPTSLRGARDT
jgi:hypothetical protein